ncbi:MAG: TerC family protein [Syntrophorhabdus sp.]
MDFSSLYNVSNILSASFLFALLNIIFINIILSGDNAVVIAMAVRSLPDKQRQQGIIFGTAGAVILRIGLTFVAAFLLTVPFVKLAGGLLILWIAFKLLLGEDEGGHEKQVNGLMQAIGTILMADLVMSLDNVLGVAGASNGNLLLLLLGLATSIPIVVFASKLITKLMDRFPIIVVLGAAILGRVAGEMIASDPWVSRTLHNPGHVFSYVVEGLLAVGVVVAAKMWIKYRPAKEAQQIPVAATAGANPFAVEGWDIL